MSEFAERLLAGRSQVYSGPDEPIGSEPVEEGGCGVTGFACTVPVKGRFIYEPSKQMQNRGNGKGGGIAAAGLVPEQLGISADMLESHYLLQIALLDPDCHAEPGAGVHPASLRHRALHAAATCRRLSRYPRPGGQAAGRAPLRGAREAGRPQNLRRSGRTAGSRAAGTRGRVRVAQLLPAQRRILRLTGREARVRAFPFAETC